VLRGSPPLGLTVDQVDGLTTGAALPLADRGDLSHLAVASLNAPGGSTLALDSDRLWQQIRAGLEQRRDGHGYRLLSLEREGGRRSRAAPGVAAEAEPPVAVAPEPPVAVAAQALAVDLDPAPEAETAPPAGPEFSGQVVVFRAGVSFDLGLPAESVVEVGPAVQARPLRGGPAHLAGLVAWRGRRVPLLDLPARLGVAERLAGPRQTLYLGLEGRAAQALALSVGEVAGTAQVPALQRSVRPPGLPKEWTLGAARLGGRMLVVLNPTTLVMA
jgi:chemotaxis signal transduction protein